MRTLRKIESRLFAFEKLAAGSKKKPAKNKRMNRKTVDNELKAIRKKYDKARSSYESSAKDLEKAEVKVQESQSEMMELKNRLITLNLAAQTMDLVGAPEVRSEKDDLFSYIINGDRHFADTSDYSDIKLMKWNERPKDSMLASDLRTEIDVIPSGDAADLVESAMESSKKSVSGADEAIDIESDESDSFFDALNGDEEEGDSEDEEAQEESEDEYEDESDEDDTAQANDFYRRIKFR